MATTFDWDPRAAAVPVVAADAKPPTDAVVFDWSPTTQKVEPSWTDRITQGVVQAGQEFKALGKMVSGMPGGIAGVAVDASSRIASLFQGDDPKTAGVKARALSDAVNSKWGEFTGALGLSPDASGSKIEQLLNWAMKKSDEGGESLEKATQGVLSLETTQSVRDTLLNVLGAKGGLHAGKTAVSAWKGEPAFKAGGIKRPLEGMPAEEPALAATPAVVTEALAGRTPLEQAWAGIRTKAEAAPKAQPWDRVVGDFFEQARAKGTEAEAVQAAMEPPRGKVKLTDPVIIGETVDILPGALDKLRRGELISAAEAKAVRSLTPRAGEGVIVGPEGKPYFERGKADPALLGVLGVLGVSALALPHLMDWWNSSGEVSGDNASDAGTLGAVLTFAGVPKAKGGFWHPETVKTLAAPLRDAMATGWNAAGDLDFSGPKTIKNWTENKVANYLNKHAGMATDPIKDLKLPTGERWEDLVDKAFTGAQAEGPKGAEVQWGLNKKPPVWGQDVPGEHHRAAAGKITSYLSHVGDYIKSQNLTSAQLQQLDLPRAIRETVANDQRIAEMALKDAQRPNPQAVHDTAALPTYKAYDPIQAGSRKFSFNKDGSIQKTQSVDLPPGEVAYAWKELKVQEALTPEQAARVRQVTKKDPVPDTERFDPEDQLYLAQDAKGNPIKDNFSNAWALGKTPQEAHLAGQLAQEGNALGHCVGGYAEQVFDGSSRILSLRDQHGRSYATVELGKDRQAGWPMPDRELSPHENIVQIKGPGNGPPADYVKPYIQDLVKSGEWGEVGDLEHAGLEKYGNKYFTPAEAKAIIDKAQLGAADSKLLLKVAGGAAAAAYLMSDRDPDKFTSLAAGMLGVAMLKGKGKFDGEAALLKGFRDLRTREAAATQIFQDTQPQLLRAIRSISKDVDAEDVAQRTYEKVFRFLAKPEGAEGAFRGEAKISTLLHTVAANEIKNQWRGEKARPRTQSFEVDSATGETQVPEGAMMEQSPELYKSTQDVVAQRALADALQGAIDKLSPDRRAVFEAAELEGLSMAEIATKFDIPENTAKTKLFRAREDLQRRLKEYTDPKTGRVNFQAGRVPPEDLAKIGLVASGVAAGTLYADDPIKGAVVGGLVGLLGSALFTHPVQRNIGRGMTQVANVLPELRRAGRDMMLAQGVETAVFSDAITNFLKQTKKLDPARVKALEDAYYAGDGSAQAQAIQGNPALVAARAELRKLYQQAGERLVAAGVIKDLLPDYLPLMVKDYKGLMATFGHDVQTGILNTLHKAEIKSRQKFGRDLSEAERALIMTNYLLREPSTSYQPGYSKARRLKMTEETKPFYHSMSDALIHNAHTVTQDLAAIKFFGADRQVLKVKGKQYTNIDASIGAITDRLLREGKVTQEGLLDLKEVFRDYFDGGRRSPAGWLQDVRNYTGIALLGQVATGLIQTSEGLFAGYHHGYKPAIEAAALTILGRGIKPREFGLANNIIEEVVGSRPSGEALSIILKANVLAMLDQGSLGVNLTASFVKNHTLAQTARGRAKIVEKWGADYGPDMPQLLKELQASTVKKRTPLVDSLVYQEISDVRPTSALEAPPGFNANPNLRFMWHLKQFTIVQADIVRRDVWHKIKTGDPKQVAIGLKNAALYSAHLAVAGVPAIAVTNWIMGRGLQLDNIDLVDNLMRNFGLSRYTMDKIASSKNPGKAVAEAGLNFVAPPAASVGVRLATGLTEPKELVPMIPVVGRAIYNREFGGNEKAAAWEAKKERLEKRDAEEKAYPQLKAARLARQAKRKETQ